MLSKGKTQKYPRESGILLHISSLPSNHGIGNLGQEAFRFVDFLKKSRQHYWQILPLNPVGEGNSPYKSVSAFAGEMLFIDLDLLVKDGLLYAGELHDTQFPQNVDYRLVREYKLPLIKKAAARFNVNRLEYRRFLRQNEYWLPDFALFMVLKDYHGGAEMPCFSEPLKFRMPQAIEIFRSEHREQIEFYKITQFLFYSQYLRLKEYAARQGIKIIGDIPFYVSLDSADVWANPDIFRLGRDMTPLQVAGVPPDSFAVEGQLWGNPVYDWDFQKITNFFWWRMRLKHGARLYDVLRIDHFRAFADYYTIPYGAKNAHSGVWEKGIGIQFWKSMQAITPGLEIIAEDLGADTPELRKLIEETGFPNMKVLQFAFNSDLQNAHLPRNFERNCVCYTGTHDNDTTLGWLKKAGKREKLIFSRLISRETGDSPVLRLINYGMRSKARMVIIPFQDYLQLDSGARMNTPGTPSGNWEWRFKPEDLNDKLSDLIRRLSRGRN